MTRPDPEPSELNQSIGAAMTNIIGQPDAHLIDRLKRRFGLGTVPAKRLSFYRRLGEIVEKHGDRAYQAISEAAAQSTDKRYPDRYFCKAVINKLKDLQLWIRIDPL